MHIRCPHCHNAIEVVEDSSFRDVECPSCGSHFNLVGGDAPTESGSTKPRRLGHFELIEQLGVGHFGAVWKAKDTTLDRFVAVKIPRKEQLNEEDIEKFFREARAAAQLRHPNIVSVHEVGRERDTIFIASDFVEGATLAEWLRGQPLGRLPSDPYAASRQTGGQHAQIRVATCQDIRVVQSGLRSFQRRFVASRAAFQQVLCWLATVTDHLNAPVPPVPHPA